MLGLGDCVTTNDAVDACEIKFKELQAELAASQARVKELEDMVAELKSQIAEYESECETCKHYDEPNNDCKSVVGCRYEKKELYRCADRDDGCGHCPRSEPHAHPDEQPGDDCYRRKGKVTCERSN